jgi:hypothetical protein
MCKVWQFNVRISSDVSEKQHFELQLALVATEPWIQTTKHLALWNGGQQCTAFFLVDIKCMKLNWFRDLVCFYPTFAIPSPSISSGGRSPWLGEWSPLCWGEPFCYGHCLLLMACWQLYFRPLSRATYTNSCARFSCATACACWTRSLHSLYTDGRGVCMWLNIC